MSEDGANRSERPRIQITEKLAEFIHEQALIAATWRCPEHSDPKDVAQEVAFVLIRRPPRFDPNGKANVETFLKSCIRNRVHSAIRKEGRFSLRQAQVIEDEQRDEDDVKKNVRSPSLHHGERPFQQDIKEFTPEDVFRYIDCDSSRELCILYLECKANMSEVARCMGVSEGTIRYRLKKLAPKLLKAGLKPFLNPQEVFFVANRRDKLGTGANWRGSVTNWGQAQIGVGPIDCKSAVEVYACCFVKTNMWQARIGGNRFDCILGKHVCACPRFRQKPLTLSCSPVKFHRTMCISNMDPNLNFQTIPAAV